MYKILVVDDEANIRKLIAKYASFEGYQVEEASDGEQAVGLCRSGSFDLIVMDIMMPGMDGLRVLQTLRGEGITTPVLFLTARTEVSQRVEGLDSGADDYLPKPFSTAELLARVRAMLRRKDTYLPDLLSLGQVTLNRSTYQLLCRDRTQALSGKEFQILEMLMQAPGTIIPTERFITHLWGWDTNVDTSVVWVHISNIRKKIAALGAPMEIRFVRNAGYVLEVRP